MALTFLESLMARLRSYLRRVFAWKRAVMQRIRWRIRIVAVAATIKPVAGGSPPDADDDDDEDDDDDSEPAEPPELPEEPGNDASPEDLKKYADELTAFGKYWKSSSRRHERSEKREPRRAGRRARKAEKRVTELEEQLEELQGKDKDKHQKALDQAKKEAREEALSESNKERRTDRLESAVTRLGAKGVKLEVKKDGETKEITVKAADPEDLLARIERKLRKGDIDEDDIFDDDHQVNGEALEDAVTELLEDNPRLRAKASDDDDDDTDEDAGGKKKRRRAKGGVADARKGGAASKDVEEMDVDDHLADVSRHKDK